MQFVKFLICTGPGKIEKYREKEQGEGEKSRKQEWERRIKKKRMMVSSVAFVFH